MAKNKKKAEQDVSLDFSKGFSTGAFDRLKSLQEKQKAEMAQKEASQRRLAEERARREAAEREAAMRATRDLRFTEDDLSDDESLSDEEIFAASMQAMESGKLDLYQSKFNSKEAPKKAPKDEPAPMTMSDEEREFAIFTQEMAMSKVQRLVTQKKPEHKVRNKKKYDQNGKVITDDAETEQPVATISPVSVSAAPSVQESGMKTDYLDPVVSVTQVEKGENVLEQPDIAETLTASQKKLLKDIRHYESRYGMLMTLRLRGLTLNAAISRLNDFFDACIRERRPYALIICGKGLNSADKPVIKAHTMDMLRSDSRVIEYVPVINEDGDFGSVYASFRLK